MALHPLVGRHVNILAWDDLLDLLPNDPGGTITNVAEPRPGAVEVTVRVKRLTRNYVFGLDEVEVLPCQPDIATVAGRD